ncbi:MAG: hypothetical protein AMXMBFR53_36760 [Gemmatimonadota bacterium]
MMDATTQACAALAMEATGYHWYRQVTVRGNVAELERIPWATALVLIQRGQSRGWVLARDVQRDPSQIPLRLVTDDDDGMALAEWAEAGSRRREP